MSGRATVNNRMRIWHRYLGFFLAGIMAVYAISGIILIFRDTNFLKTEKKIEKKLEANLSVESLGKAIKIKELRAESESGDTIKFKQGYYNRTTGMVKYTQKSMPFLIEKLTKLHKANSKSPLFFLNIFFGASLLFFVLSSFWMFMPKTSIFKKGLYYTLAGVLLTLIMLFF
ncbi:MAG: PepSY domain-containing protein [Chitinophagaceae bacterium]|nr:MAG: PepSY domain-containing protein [Chitinophagaceae bacterium]